MNQNLDIERKSTSVFLFQLPFLVIIFFTVFPKCHKMLLSFAGRCLGCWKQRSKYINHFFAINAKRCPGTRSSNSKAISGDYRRPRKTSRQMTKLHDDGTVVSLMRKFYAKGLLEENNIFLQAVSNIFKIFLRNISFCSARDWE